MHEDGAGQRNLRAAAFQHDLYVATGRRNPYGIVKVSKKRCAPVARHRIGSGPATCFFFIQAQSSHTGFPAARMSGKSKQDKHGVPAIAAATPQEPLRLQQSQFSASCCVELQTDIIQTGVPRRSNRFRSDRVLRKPAFLWSRDLAHPSSDGMFSSQESFTTKTTRGCLSCLVYIIDEWVELLSRTAFCFSAL